MASNLFRDSQNEEGDCSSDLNVCSTNLEGKTNEEESFSIKKLFQNAKDTALSWIHHSPSNPFTFLGSDALQEKEDYRLNRKQDEITRLKRSIATLLQRPIHDIRKMNTDHHFKFGITKIPHNRQSESWDCGLTCVQMILGWIFKLNQEQMSIHHAKYLEDSSEKKSSYSNSKDYSDEKKWMMKTVQTTSIWTIDLVFLLETILFSDNSLYNTNFQIEPLSNDFTISYLFSSRNLGVDDSYCRLSYYKNAFKSDEVRVKGLFDLAREKNLPILQVSHLELELVVHIISREECVAIVLVDSKILESRNKIVNQSYSGHYIILCGVSSDQNDIKQALGHGKESDEDYCLVIKNPGSNNDADFVMPSHFERSWRACGTDNDIIFLAVHKKT